MTREGRLTINAGISRLDDTRLMRGALDNGGFGRATSFLRQERQLKSGDRIFVDGNEREFDGDDVILVTNAGRAMAAGAAAFGAAVGGRKSGRSTKEGRARTAKKSTTKRSAKKKLSHKRSTKKKSAAKRSTKKKASGQRAAKK